jgi:outer membrane protein assembly factor BamB
MKHASLALLLAILLPRIVSADWLQFRGPGGLGIASDKNTPVTWSADKNVAWKTEMPGFGASSPIVVGDKVFVLCYSGYGLDRDEPGEPKKLKRHLVCADRKNGKVLWTRDFAAALPEAAYSGPYITLHGFASSTPISDGKNIYLFLGKSGVYAFDLDGKQQWKADVGKGTHGWGTGTSPILYKDLLIINASVESKSLVALDKKTGNEVWKAKEITESWNTPCLAKLLNGKTELAVAARQQMLGIDPDTGKELWSADVYDWYVCPSIVADNGVFYGLQHSIAVAVKGGGKGDVTKSHVIWHKNFGAVVASPLVYQGHVYWAANGTAFCVKAADGSTVYRERLKGSSGENYASPVFADGKLYYVSRESGTYVVEVGAKFKLLAHNTLNPDTSIFNATPAVSGSQLFLRSDRYLYCIGH